MGRAPGVVETAPPGPDVGALGAAGAGLDAGTLDDGAGVDAGGGAADPAELGIADSGVIAILLR